jgi:hypothetical protein
METLNHLNTGVDENYLNDDEYAQLRQQWGNVRFRLVGYISYLKNLSPKDRRFNG